MTCFTLKRAIPALALTLITGSAAASGIMAQCQLVPYAYFNDGEDTTVGLISNAGGTIHWIMYDQEGQRLDTDFFEITENTFEGFSLADSARESLNDTLGFLLFCLDDNNDDRINFDDDPDLSANAFLIRTGDSDVAYLPVLPVFSQDLDSSDRDDEVTDWDNDPIDTLNSVAEPEDKLYMRYFTDGAENSGDDTQIYLFTTRGPNDNIDVNAVGPDADVTVDVPLGQSRLNVIDPETVSVLNVDGLIGSGFLKWEVDNNVRNAFAFSLVRSPAFGALQTLVGSYDDDD